MTYHLCTKNLERSKMALPTTRHQIGQSIQRDVVLDMQAETASEISTIVSLSNFTSERAGRFVAAGWIDRFEQLRDFNDVHGHTLVPKRYKSNPSLGNWVNKQRQFYHNFLTGKKPCSLTEERIDLLNQLNFCWNASAARLRDDDVFKHDATLEDEWWSRYDELYTVCQHDNDIHKINRRSRLGIWLDRQRKIHEHQKSSALVTTNNQTATASDNAKCLTDDQLVALSRISEVWWMNRRQWQWELRYRDLQQFSSKYGHCCVPISYSDNKQLAHWVSNQRKLNNLRLAGKRSELTPSRIQKLNAIGFVWNLWDYEFSIKKSKICDTENRLDKIMKMKESAVHFDDTC
jgi:hypothetical protein